MFTKKQGNVKWLHEVFNGKVILSLTNLYRLTNWKFTDELNGRMNTLWLIQGVKPKSRFRLRGNHRVRIKTLCLWLCIEYLVVLFLNLTNQELFFTLFFNFSIILLQEMIIASNITISS